MLPNYTSTTEDVFARHYDWLLKWALYMTRGQKEQSEDLVHELYIQFLRTAPDLQGGEEAKAYLYRSLRNLYLSQCARSARSMMRELSIYDYDSLQLGISNIDRSSLLSVHEDLWEICRYACDRRSSLRAASYFILRFFLDYLPSEIMAIGNISRASFDKAIQQMRSEVHGLLRQDATVVPIRRTSPPPTHSIFYNEDLTEQTSRYIHSAAPGQCFSQSDVDRMYASSSPVDTQSIAHISSCLRCRLLCLKYFGESGGGPEERGVAAKKPASIHRVKQGRLSRLNRSYRSNFEHRPTYLHLVLAGKTEASQYISSSHSELTASVPFDGDATFVELASEQGVRLVNLPVERDMNRAAEDVVIHSELSDGRSISVRVALLAATLHVSATYADPVLEEAIVAQSNETQSLSVERRASLLQRIWNGIRGAYWPWIVAVTAACALLVSLLPPGKTAQRERALHLLLQNRQAETVLLADHDVRRTGVFRLEGPAGYISEGRIEVWETSSPSRKVMALIGPDGKSQNIVPPATLSRLFPEQIWQTGFDTGKIEEILSTGSASVNSPTANVIKIEAKGAASSSEEWDGSVVLDSNAHHVVEQNLILHRAKNTYHVRIVETSYEIHPKGTFHPDARVISPKAFESHAVSKLPTTAAIVRQYIGALWGMQQAGVKSNEQLTISRHKEGVIVAGIVNDAMRKKYLSNILEQGCEGCIVHLKSADALPQVRRHVLPTTVQVEELHLEPSSAEEILSAANRADVHQLSIARMDELNRLASSLAYAFGMLETTATCCSQAELTSIPVEERQRWRELIVQQTDEAGRQLASIQKKVEEFNRLAGIPPFDPTMREAIGLTGPEQMRLLHRKAVQLQLEMQRFGAATKDPDAGPLQRWHSIQSLVFEITQQANNSPSILRNTR